MGPKRKQNIAKKTQSQKRNAAGSQQMQSGSQQMESGSQQVETKDNQNIIQPQKSQGNPETSKENPEPQQQPDTPPDLFSLMQLKLSDIDKLIELQTAERDDVKEKLKQSMIRSHELYVLKVAKRLELAKLKVQEKNDEAFLENIKQSVIELQARYNDVVDPFNEVTAGCKATCDTYKAMAKMYNEKKKAIAGFRDELAAEVNEVVEKIEDAYQQVIFHRESLSAADQLLTDKEEELNRKRLEQESLEAEMGTFDVDGMKKMLEEAERSRAQNKEQLRELQNQVPTVEKAIQELEEKFAVVDNATKIIQQRVDEQVANTKILDQRIDNEKNIVQQVLETKSTRFLERIEKCNFNMARVLQKLLELKTHEDQELTETNQLIEEIKRSIVDLDLSKVEIEKVNEELTNEVDKFSVFNPELEAKRKDLAKHLDKVKLKKHELQKKLLKITSSYGKKIAKEQHHQVLIGDMNQEDQKSSSSGKSDSESIASKLSSSISEFGQFKVEKVNFDTTLNVSVDESVASKTL